MNKISGKATTRTTIVSDGGSNRNKEGSATNASQAILSQANHHTANSRLGVKNGTAIQASQPNNSFALVRYDNADRPGNQGGTAAVLPAEQLGVTVIEEDDQGFVRRVEFFPSSKYPDHHYHTRQNDSHFREERQSHDSKYQLRDRYGRPIDYFGEDDEEWDYTRIPRASDFTTQVGCGPRDPKQQYVQPPVPIRAPRVKNSYASGSFPFSERDRVRPVNGEYPRPSGTRMNSPSSSRQRRSNIRGHAQLISHAHGSQSATSFADSQCSSQGDLIEVAKHRYGSRFLSNGNFRLFTELEFDPNNVYPRAKYRETESSLV